jgi:hypothetical protein
MTIHDDRHEEPALDIDGNRLYENARCTIAAVHHPAFSKEIGRKVVVARLRGQMAWIYNDQPVRYRINRAGRSVVDHDPRCIQTATSAEFLWLNVGARRDPDAGEGNR